jgi:rieske iron-sulfur protein
LLFIDMSCAPASNTLSSSSPTVCGGCCAADPHKRQSLLRMAAGAAALGGLSPAFAALADGPQVGDWLVSVDADTPTPLTTADLQLDAKQVFAFPHDPTAGRTRDGSRLNRVLLLKLAPATLDAETQTRAADGVLAYSGVCTHQGCDVSSWRPQEKTLLCFCHFSQFQPAQGGTVVAGPAPRSLPYLPLRSEGGRLVVAGPFSAQPGGHT